MNDFCVQNYKSFLNQQIFSPKNDKWAAGWIVCRPRVFFLDVSLVSLYSVYKAELYAVAVIVLQSAS